MEQTPLFELRLEPTTNGFLAETAKWAKFIAIIGFILCALMAVLGIFAGAVFGAALSEAGAFPGIGTGFFTVIYILIALIWFLPFLYLFNFASKMQVALRNNDQLVLNQSFQNLKSCFKYIGIFTIIMLGLYALIIVFGIAAGIGSAF